MLQIKNPYFKSAPEKKAEQHAAALDAWLKTVPNKATVSIADLKVAFPAIADDLTREMVNEACQRLGLVILNPEDAEGVAG